MVHHVSDGRVSGGVDVFFLVSGFLLTGQLARAAERGPLDLPARWSRMARRLLPSATVVLLATIAAGALLLPETRWPQTVREIIASALFLENWQLAADAVDYTARNNTTSVVQHFWSLSIQVQFFLVWPLAVALVALVARRAPHRLHAHLTATLLGVFAVSLSCSIALTAADQPLAYFHSLTRLWEFALGGLLALWIDRVPWTRGERVAFGWAGVLGLVACGFVLDGGSTFPGYAALWPTLAGALVLLGGVTRSGYGVHRLLLLRPVQFLGEVSYPLYLWHWPVLVLFMVARDQDEVGPLGGIAVIMVSFVLAVLTSRFVESPLRRVRLSDGDAYRYGAAAVAVVLLAAAIWQSAATRREIPSDGLGGPQYPGAAALVDGEPEPAPLLPAPVSVYQDWVWVQDWDCAPLSEVAADICTQPVEAPPERRILVVGDSHLEQFIAALVPIARQHDWQLIGALRGACPFSTASEVDPDDAECVAWNAAVADEITELRPDAVITLATRDVRSGLTEQTPPGFVEQWRRLADLDIPVLAVRDNPRFAQDVPDCIRRQGREGDPCGVDRDTVYAADPPYAQLDVPSNVSFLDLADYVCTDTRCPAEIGNVLVYLDDNHLTASYATTMAPVIEDQVVSAVGG
ncbi:peptidoglycan/LPS O-acetylase OafA/YrhL [Pseudonocardia hierapolitana]|uniref:Peptidoglycan/LPS O-acetylase OafA/YrhL n=1 Tax=Pseudonocardia hierapolitana TaxID=1128676 RepID=A0A561SMY9_9PSEU|nr:peptidoglycan/LPS O-acetylase OafA/YrhL [Pseudonocardia hierapolitana]